MEEKNGKNIRRKTLIGNFKIIDRYIIRKFISTFILFVMVLSVVSIVIDIAEKMEKLFDKQASQKEIFYYYVNFIPYITAYLFPLFVFISVVFFTTRLTYKSEVIAMLNSGMTFKRFLRPYVISSVFLALFIFLLNHYVIPKANRKRMNFENKYINTNSITSNSDMHLRISKNEFVYVKSFNWEGKIGYSFSYEKIYGQDLKEKFLAENIKWDSIKKLWHLTNVVVRTNNGKFETFKKHSSLDKKMAFTPKDLTEEFEFRQTMTTPQLNKFIANEESRGNPSLSSYRVEKHRRTAAPFSVIILSIIGACLASHKVRGGSGIHLVLGLLISGSYIVFMQFSSTFAVKGNVSPMLAVWIPNIIFAILAFYIFRRFNK